jgi:hypothetical protein
MTNRLVAALVNFLPWRMAGKSNHYIETLRCLIAFLRQLRPTTKAYKILHHHDNAKPHKIVRPIQVMKSDAAPNLRS